MECLSHFTFQEAHEAGEGAAGLNGALAGAGYVHELLVEQSGLSGTTRRAHVRGSAACGPQYEEDVASGFRIEYGPPVPVASITPLDQRVDIQNAIRRAAAIELDGPVGEMVELRGRTGRTFRVRRRSPLD